MPLKASGPITASSSGQVIENKIITAHNTNGISVYNVTNVTIRNCVIRWTGTNFGIYASLASGLKVHDCAVIYDSAPHSGPNSGLTHNIGIGSFGNASNNVVINNVYLEGGVDGIYVEGCDNVTISGVEGKNFHGNTADNGSLVYFTACTNCSLSDFYVFNDLNVAWTGDCVNAFNSPNINISNGVCDGNNNISGAQVIFEDSTGTCTDVDGLNWSNVGFSAWGLPAVGVMFRRCRIRDSYAPCTQGRGAPNSGSLAFSSFNGASGTIFENCEWYNLVNPNPLILDASSCALVDLRQNNFTPRTPYRYAGPKDGSVTPVRRVTSVPRLRDSP